MSAEGEESIIQYVSYDSTFDFLSAACTSTCCFLEVTWEASVP